MDVGALGAVGHGDRLRKLLAEPRCRQEIAHRRHGLAQPIVSELSAELHHRQHGAGAVLPAMPIAEPVPQAVEGGRPAPGLPPLIEGLRTGEGARLMAQHVEVVIEVQHMLATPIAAFVTGQPAPTSHSSTCVG